MKLNGNEIAEEIYHDLQQRVGELQKKNIMPHLVVILIGENAASEAYVNQKQKAGEKIGAKVTILRFDKTIANEEIEKKIEMINQDPFVHGILIQRPVPNHINIAAISLLSEPQKDVDGFHPESPYTLPLPLAVIKILEQVYATKTTPHKFRDWLQSKSIALIGKGEIGGQPILAYLRNLQVPSHVIDSKTEHPEQIMKQADIIISAVGKHVIRPAMLKEGVILIGVGLYKGADGNLHGDYEEDEIKDIASFYTSTPGGVGPVNVAMLLDNLVTATEKQTI